MMQSIRTGALLAGALLGAGAAEAQTWHPVRETPEARFTVELETIERTGNSVRFWRVVQFSSPQTLPDGVTLDSIASHVEGDCAKLTTRRLRTDARLRGELIQSDPAVEEEFHEVNEGTPGYDVLRFACSR
jgi:hypothetical protein